MTAINPSYTSTIGDGLYSCGVAIGDGFNATTQKIKDIVTSPVGQVVIGIGLGVLMHQVYSPLTEKIINALGVTSIASDPFSDLGFGEKILLTPFVCLIGPAFEEILFREGLQGMLKHGFQSFYENQGFSDYAANIAARVTSVFFASVIFGLTHFSNAIVFWCNPVLFLPQVVACIIMGVMFGLARECSGDLILPISMHVGNNTLAWALHLSASL